MSRSREDRRRVVLASRMRWGGRWLDARMLNLSSRGLGLSSTAPPDPGTYVEIRRGRHVIVARVVWADGLRFGVHTQDPIPIDGLIRDPDSDQPGTAEAESEHKIERRRTTRPAAVIQHEHSRIVGRMIEFAFLGGLAASAALMAFYLVKGAVGGPLSEVQKALVG